MSSFVTVTAVLPCGHEISRTCSVEELRPNWITDCAEVLQWWADSRVAKHDCSLVGKDNPSGYPKSEPGTGFGDLT